MKEMVAKKLRKLAPAFMAMLLSASMIAGCGQSSPNTNAPTVTPSASTGSSATPTPAAEPVALSIMLPDLGRVLKTGADNPPLQALEAATNTKLELTLVPQAEYGNKINVIASSGDFADIVRLNGFTYQDYVNQGLFLEIGDLIEQYGPNLKATVSQKAWDYTLFEGERYCIPYENVQGKFITILRQDWLNNLGLSVPSTLEEYRNILVQFTNNDPDQNGKKDTYGLGPNAGWSDTYFSPEFDVILGAFGIMQSQSYEKDGKVYNAMISDEYRAATEYIRDLWKDGLIDPEMFTAKADQARENLTQGKSGTTTGWWSTAPQTLVNQNGMGMDQWVPVDAALTGPSGASGYQASGLINATVLLSTNCENPEAAISFLDYLATDEGWLLTGKGIEGEYWTKNTAVDFGGALTELGEKAYSDKWLDPLSQMISRQDLVAKWGANATDETTVYNNIYINGAANKKMYTDFFYGVPASTESQTYGADLAKYQIISFIEFVTGAKELNDANWNTYVDTWKNTKSGLKIMEASLKNYNSLYGTSFTLGY